MVNILDFWTHTEDVPKYTVAMAQLLINNRLEAKKGFDALERRQGQYPEHTNLALPHTQDYMRTLGFRFFEELSEALESETIDHYLEELIDAVNYLLNMALLDPNYILYEEVAEVLDKAISYVEEKNYWGHTHLVDDLRLILTSIAGDLGDSLRNRSWMVQAQDTMWAGKASFLETVEKVLISILTEFVDWEQFYQYFDAKHKVLMFRLDTKY